MKKIMTLLHTMSRLFRFSVLFFSAGLAITNVAFAGMPKTLATTGVADVDFNYILFERVLSDSQEQAKFAQKILGEAYREPTAYAGEITIGNATVEYVAEHGKIDWHVVGSGLADTFDALKYLHENSAGYGKSPIPNNTVLGVITVIVVIGVACGLLNNIATNNCIRACGQPGVQSTDFFCGQASSKASCQCKPDVHPQPTPGPYPGGPSGTGPDYNGYMEYQGPQGPNCYEIDPSGCGGGAGGFAIVNQQDIARGQYIGQGWMTP